MSKIAADKTIDLNLPELVNLTAKILDRMFVQSPKDKAKPIFKDLKNKLAVLLGTIDLQPDVTSELKLVLEYSEFRGPGFNYDIFAAALHSILKQVSQAFQKKAELNVMTSEDGTVLVHLPGAIVFEGQLNVMVMAFEFFGTQSIQIKLMFLDPDQYEPYRDSAALTPAK